MDYQGQIFNVDYHLYYGKDYVPNSIKETNFLRKSRWARGKAVTYIKSHCEKNNSNFIDYANNYEKTEGLFNDKKDFTKADVKAFKKKLKETDATVYTAIFSFGEELKDYIKTAGDAKETIQKTIGKFFKTAFKTPGKYAYDPHLKMDDFERCGAVHTNKEHMHVHLIFFEKEKNFTRKKGKEMTYWTTLHPKIEIENLNNYRFYVSNYVFQNEIDYEKRDLFLDAFKDTVKSKNVNEIIRDYALKMDDFNVKQYARLTDKNKKIVKDCFDELIKVNPFLKKKKDDFESQLDMLQANFNKINDANMIKKVEDFKEKRMEDIFKRSANNILKVMIQSRKIKKLNRDYKKNRSSNYRYYPNDPKLIRAKAIEIRQNEYQHDRDVKELIKILSSVDYWDFNYEDLSKQIGAMRD